MLRAQFKNRTYPDDDVLKVEIGEGFALPLVRLFLPFPVVSG
jgi:hypothetical protein